MNKYVSAQVLSSSAGLATLAALVTAAIWWTSNGRATPGELLLGNFLAAAFACLVWSGIFDKKGARLATESALAWLSMGAIGESSKLPPTQEMGHVGVSRPISYDGHPC